MSGRLIAVVGPSGAGKDTLIEAACAARPGLRRVRRVITRTAGAGGEVFDAVTEAEFLRRRDSGDFALDWQAHGLLYGIPASEIRGGGAAIFNGSRAALPAAQACFPDLTVILVTAPAEVLAARLAGRARETSTDIEARLARAADPHLPFTQHRVVVNNGTPEQGLARFLAALRMEGL